MKGEAFETEVWKDFRIAPPRTSKEIEDELRLGLKQRDIELVDAVQDLQLKVGGVEMGNVARFLGNTWRWFNVGVPTIASTASISDTAQGEKEVTLRLTRSVNGMDFATASASHQNAAEAARLAAERAAYKLLYHFASTSVLTSRVRVCLVPDADRPRSVSVEQSLTRSPPS